MPLKKFHRIRVGITWLAIVTALATFIMIPAMYFYTAYSYEKNRIQAEASFISDSFSKIIYVYPELWRYQNHKFIELLRRSQDDFGAVKQRVLDIDGSEIVAIGTEPPAPTITAYVELGNGFSVVGTLEVSESYRPILVRTGIAAAVSALLALAIFVALRMLPLRVLARVLRDLEASYQDLALSKDAAESADKTKSEFLATMSHELRTPLNAIIGFSEMIKEEIFGPIGDAKYRDYITDINDSATHLLNLINDILEFSKAEAGKLEMHEEMVGIREMVESTLRLVQPRAQAGVVEIVCDIPEDLPTLRADERKLKQILLNLLSNAIKFTPQGGKVFISAKCDRGQPMTLTVRDTGIGIAPEDLETVLTPFGQVESALNRTYEGTGLGLPLVVAMVELHGGKVTLDSVVGSGTIVTVSFAANRVAPEFTIGSKRASAAA